jgi:hypothetical protein
VTWINNFFLISRRILLKRDFRMRRDLLPGIALATLLCAGCGTASEQKAVPTSPPTPEVAQMPAAEPAPAAEPTPPAVAAPPATELAPAESSSAPVDQPQPAVVGDMPAEAFKAIVTHATEGLPQAMAKLANRGVPGKISYDVTHTDSPATPYTAVLTFNTRSDSADNQSTSLWTARYAFQDHKWALTHLEWQTTSLHPTGSASAAGRRSRDVVELKKVVFPKGRESTAKDDAIINVLKGE